MSALSIAFLLLGSIIGLFDITMVIITSVLVLIAREEMGYKSLAIYVVTATIAILLLPNKVIAIEYLVISIYPVIKPVFDKQSGAVKWMLKIVYILSASLCLVLAMKILTPDSPMYWDAILGVGFILVFFLYDVLLHKFTMYYRFKLRHQLRIDKFFNQK